MLSSTIAFFLIPLAVISCLYYQIARKLKQATLLDSFTHSDIHLTDHATSRKIVQSRKIVIRMLVVIVIVFTFCWSPFHAQRLLFLYVTLYSNWNNQILRQINSVLFLSAGCLYYLNSSLNPLIYSLLSTRFRTAFMLYVNGCCGSSLIGNHHHHTSTNHSNSNNNNNNNNTNNNVNNNGGNGSRSRNGASNGPIGPKSISNNNNNNNHNTSSGTNGNGTGALGTLKNTCLTIMEPGIVTKVQWNKAAINNGMAPNDSTHHHHHHHHHQQHHQHHYCHCLHNTHVPPPSTTVAPMAAMNNNYHHYHQHKPNNIQPNNLVMQQYS